MQPRLPEGADMNVLDLGQLRKPKDPIFQVVQPGDHVMVLLPPNASHAEIAQVQQYLKQWAPQTEFIVMSGPESITVIPSMDKAPQGDSGDGSQIDQN
jgi:hypothetical protein